MSKRSTLDLNNLDTKSRDSFNYQLDEEYNHPGLNKVYSNRRSIQNIRIMDRGETIEAYDGQARRFKDRSTIIRRKLSDMSSNMPQLSPF